MKENHNNISQNVGLRGDDDAMYTLRTIGSLAYYIQQAHGLWLINLAVLQAFAVYDLLKFIH